MTIDELITKLEQAGGPDAALDAMIHCLLSGIIFKKVIHRNKFGTPTAYRTNKGDVSAFRLAGYRYTRKIDDALTLILDGWKWKVSTERHASFTEWAAHAEIMDRDWADPQAGYGVAFDGHGATPAIALCIAALRARKAKG